MGDRIVLAVVVFLRALELGGKDWVPCALFSPLVPFSGEDAALRVREVVRVVKSPSLVAACCAAVVSGLSHVFRVWA